MRDRVGADPIDGCWDVGKCAACQELPGSIRNVDDWGLSPKGSEAETKRLRCTERTNVRSVKTQ